MAAATEINKSIRRVKYNCEMFLYRIKIATYYGSIDWHMDLRKNFGVLCDILTIFSNISYQGGGSF